MKSCQSLERNPLKYIKITNIAITGVSNPIKKSESKWVPRKLRYKIANVVLGSDAKKFPPKFRHRSAGYSLLKIVWIKSMKFMCFWLPISLTHEWIWPTETE